MRRIILLWLTVTLTTCFGLELVTDGKARISTESGTDPAEKWAEAEFKRVIKNITGAEIASGSAAPFRLVIGTPETSPEIQKAQGILQLPAPTERDTFILKSQGNTIYAAGNNPHSATYAVFALLEELGCRWFWPTAHGEFLPPPAKNLSVKELNKRESAAFLQRMFGAHSNMEKAEFMAHNKMTITMDPTRRFDPAKFDRMRTYGSSHTFGRMQPPPYKNNAEYFKHHPDHFALNDGVRTDKQHCYTNPEVKRNFVNYLLDFWKKNPEIVRFSLGPLDTPYYCKCEECSKYDPSTLTFRFMSGIINEVNKSFPDKQYRTASYSFYVNPPQCELPDNLLNTYCMYNRCYKHPFDSDCPVNPRALAGMKAWQKVLKKVGVYGYQMDALSGAWFTPHAFVLADEFRTLKKHGIDYYTTENYFHINYKKPLEQSSAFTNRFAIWLVSRMLWDSTLDEKLLLKDFCRIFGKAAPEMEQYYLEMQKAWSGQGHTSHYFGSSLGLADDFITPQLIEKVDPLLESAKKSAGNDKRARDLVEAEEKAWLEWKNLRLSRDAWQEIAEDKHPERLALLLKAEPGRTLFALDPRKKDALGWSSKARIEVGKDENGTDYISFFPQKGAGTSGSSKLFGDHPRNFTKPCQWVNYELSFQFRFPEKAEKFMTLYVYLRSNHQSQRFEKFPFGSYEVGISPNQLLWQITSRPADQPKFPGGKVKFKENFELNKWIDVKIRVVDCRMTVRLDGREYVNAKVPLGGGIVNFRSYAKYDLRNVRLKEIPTPSIQQTWNVKVPLVEKAPNLSGKGDDPIWQKAAKSSSFKAKGDKFPVAKTDVYLLRTDKALYLRADCFEDMSKLRTIRTRRDDDLWNDTNIELCLDPNATRTDYYYLIVNSDGVQYDALATMGLQLDKSWNGKWKCAVTKHKDKWIAEVELPFSTFPVVRGDGNYLLGLTRCGTGITQTWTDGTFHSPNSFKTLLMK